MNFPLISVIVPNYNHAAFLKQRINSVLNQTYQNIEIIILDDCSTDNSKEIIEHFAKHEKVTNIIYNPKNSGSTFKQWKKGLELAKGEYIWIAESDDFADIIFLQTAVNALNKCKNKVLFNCNSYIINEKNELRTNNLSVDLPSGCYSGNDFIKKFLVDRNRIVNASACVFKKQHALQIINHITNFKIVGDWLFWILLLNNHTLAYSDKKLNYFRETSFSTRKHTNWQKKITRLTEELSVLDYILSLNLINKQVLSSRLKSIKDRLCWSAPSLFHIIKINNKQLKHSGFSISKLELITHCFLLKISSLKRKFNKNQRPNN
jgi:glycosyltransferase involved in cell wall biosynthesis